MAYPSGFSSLRAVVILRIINAFWVTTFFQPDEFFQALEPAWDLAFGPESGAWLTWEWHHQLRSSIHPVLFALVYLVSHHVSNWLPISTSLQASIIVAAPRALQAVIAALGDWYTWQLAVKVYPNDSNVSSFALFLQLFSAWQWYCSIRTFSNSLETTLTVMALYYYPWHELMSSNAVVKENTKPGKALRRRLWSLRVSLSLAALAVLLRPTNILIWATIIGVSLTRVSLTGASPLRMETIVILFREAFICGSLVLSASIVCDRLYFGFWTFPPYNWLNFNISKSLAVFYGRNPWHYYLLQGLPLLCTSSLPFVLSALYKPRASNNVQSNILRTMSMAFLTTILALSLISHKEVRFIYPLLPILNVIAAPHAASFFTSPTSSTTPTLRHKPYLCAALGLNILLAGYLSLFHQPAPLSVLTYLRSEYHRIHPAALSHESSISTDNTHLFALFLMPCHSTPWRSHLFYPHLTAYALSCEPPLHTSPNTPERDLYRDEADRFYDDPVGFLSKELFNSQRDMPIPRYIAGFEGIKPWLQDFTDNTPEGKATGMEPREVWSAFNGLFNDDSRRSGRMVVWDTGVYQR